MTQLNDLEFSDIYLGKEASWLAGVPGKLDPVPAPVDCIEELNELRRRCEEEASSSGRKDFNVKGNILVFRASILKSLNEIVYVLRRYPKEVPNIETLGIHQGHIKLFMKPNLTGLIVIAGAYAQGKTTTASSIICGRISQYGGVAVTIEDPPEMPLEGRHGEGVCYQTWVTQGGFAQGCRQAARWSPSIIFLGEVRDAETASEALRASINGRLVICTTHADNVSMAVERLYSLALAGVTGNSDDVASLLSSGLTAVAHQQLVSDANGVKHPKLKMLWLGSDKDDQTAQGVRNTIRQKRFDHVENEVQLQLNRLMMARPGPG